MFEKTALELSAAIKAKKISVPDVISAYIEKIEKDDKKYNAFISVAKESALKRAKEVQSQLDSGDSLSRLAGVPIALNDNISVKDIGMTCASKMLGNYKPVFNAALVDRLERAGLIIIGKLNMNEFGLGSSGGTQEPSGAYGAACNPWDAERTAGSSSNAAAITAGEIPLAIGIDTGGGLRQSCSFCGVTGIKPTYGSVSRFGIAACASSLDQAGTLGRDIEDNAALLSLISGPGGMNSSGIYSRGNNSDSTCIIEKPFDFGEQVSGDHIDKIKNVKIGLPKNYLSGDLNEDVKNAVINAAKEFEKTGAVIEEFEMPLTEYIIPTYLIISSAEVSSNLAKYDGLKYGYRSPDAKTLSEAYRFSRNEGFGLEVKRRIMLGSFVLSSKHYETFYKKALQIRTLIREAYNKLFEQFDIILSPVSPAPAYKLGEHSADPVKMYMEDFYTASVNLAGLPAVALPCGFDRNGLPIGFQLIGKAFSENKLVNTARIYQGQTSYHTKAVL
jgi:aspartyl-tRNA(Asn)/glutamyl-tRNA(Gln) amidotransferase subunit A